MTKPKKTTPDTTTPSVTASAADPNAAAAPLAAPAVDPTIADLSTKLAAAMATIEAMQAAQATVAAPTAPAAPAVSAVSAEDARRLSLLNDALLASSEREQAAKRLAEASADEEVYRVTSLIGASLSVLIADAKGQPKLVQFNAKGDVQYLTASQVADVRTSTSFFEHGYLDAPEVVEATPNTIRDMAAFVAALPVDAIRTRVNEITHPDVAFSLYHFLADQRVAMEGEDLRTVDLPPKETMLLHAVVDRLRALTGVNIATSDSE